MHRINPRFPVPAILALTLYPFTLVQRSCDSVQKLRNDPFPIVVCAEREKMNERVTPGLCSYYFSARFQKLAAPFSFCQARKEKHMFLESKLGHFRFFILRPSNLGLFRLCLQHVARKKKNIFRKLAKCSVCDLKSRVFPTKKPLLVFLAEKISVRAFLLNICLMCYYVLSNTRNTPPSGPRPCRGGRHGSLFSVLL